MISLKHLFIAGGLAVIAALAMPGPASANSANVQRYGFILQKIGQTHTIPLPAARIPIYVMVSASPGVAPGNSQSELMTAVVNWDSATLQLTWIGTSSNGAQSNGATGPGNPNPQIASIAGNYTLTPQAPGTNTPNGSLVITYAGAFAPANPAPVTFAVSVIW